LLQLKRLGFDVVNVPRITHDGYSADVVVTVQCHVLERFLLRTAIILGVHPIFNVNVTGFQCGDSPCHVTEVSGVEADPLAPVMVQTDSVSSFPAHVVVYAAGKQSRHRRSVAPIASRHHVRSVILLFRPVSWHWEHGIPQTSVKLADRTVVDIPGLHQVTLLAVLAPNVAGIQLSIVLLTDICMCQLSYAQESAPTCNGTVRGTSLIRSFPPFGFLV
jgi:hypothetical protein